MTLTLERENQTLARSKALQPVRLGVEKLLKEKVELVSGARIGLICNQASVNHEYEHAADLFHQQAGIELKALFGPQHGIRGDVQDNMRVPAWSDVICCF